jgi:hypothetical protein
VKPPRTLWLEEWLPQLVLVAVVLGLLVVAVVYADRRCTDNGGQGVRVNCHVVEDQSCITTDIGNGIAVTSCMPTTSTVCDVVCCGARAEATERQ